MANSKGELTFKKGDILYVTDTMYNGHMGCWRACLVNEEDAQKREIGMIPSRMKYVEQLTTKVDFAVVKSCIGVVVSWLVRRSTPDRAVWLPALVGDIVLCS